MSRKSIRFYNDHEVRAVWNEDKSQWFFSIVDIVAAITGSPRPRVYWGLSRTDKRKNTASCIQNVYN